MFQIRHEFPALKVVIQQTIVCAIVYLLYVAA